MPTLQVVYYSRATDRLLHLLKREAEKINVKLEPMVKGWTSLDRIDPATGEPKDDLFQNTETLRVIVKMGQYKYPQHARELWASDSATAAEEAAVQIAASGQQDMFASEVGE